MKYFQKITLCLAAIVVMALGNKAVAAAAPGAAFDATGGTDLTVTDSYISGTITVNDVDISDGKAVIFTGTHDVSVAMNIEHGLVKVGAGGAKTTQGLTKVINPAAGVASILEITAATANCIAGDVEVESGGILQVDDDIPASGGPFAIGADLTVRGGAVLKLAAGVTWSKNVTVS